MNSWEEKVLKLHGGEVQQKLVEIITQDVNNLAGHFLNDFKDRGNSKREVSSLNITMRVSQAVRAIGKKHKHPYQGDDYDN